MPHPVLLLAGVVLAKKAVGVSLYYAGKRYGWGRLYRRVLELNNSVTPAGQRALVRAAAREVLRFPAKAQVVLERSEVAQFLRQAAARWSAAGGLQAAALARVARSIAAAPRTWVADVWPAIEKDVATSAAAAGAASRAAAAAAAAASTAAAAATRATDATVDALAATAARLRTAASSSGARRDDPLQ